MVMGTAIDSGSLLVTLMSSFGVSLGLTLQLKMNESCSELFMMRLLGVSCEMKKIVNNTELEYRNYVFQIEPLSCK